MVNAQFKLLTDTAKLPIFGNNDDSNAGLDIFADQSATIPPKQSRVINTGLAWNPILDLSNYPFWIKLKLLIIKKLYKIEMEIRSRSGLSVKHSLEVGAGTIDENFRGEIKIHLYNFGETTYTVSKGDRIAQGIIDIKPKVRVTRVESISDSKRGKNGFGSTGI